MWKIVRWRLVIAIFGLFVGCTSSGDDDASDDDAVDDDDADDDVQGDDDTTAGDAPLPHELAGRIVISESRWYGGVDDSPSVEVSIWATAIPSDEEILAEEGDCKLIVGDRTEPFLCDPECDWGELCVDGECLPYPELAPAGTLTVQGLNAEVVLEPDEQGWYPGAWDLPGDLFSPGAPVHVTTTGGATPALDLSAEGVQTLVADDSMNTFEPGEDYALTWEPTTEGRGRIQLRVMTGWHGSANLTTILCETEDDGELVVPASLTSEFQIPSCGECEVSYFGRFTRDVVDFGDGPIELLVTSRYAFVPWWNE